MVDRFTYLEAVEAAEETAPDGYTVQAVFLEDGEWRCRYGRPVFCQRRRRKVVATRVEYIADAVSA